MKIHLNKVDDDFCFEAINEDGKSLRLDAGTSIGGKASAFSPMQAVLAAIGGCSAIDILNILRKQKQEITRFEMVVDGNRVPGQVPSPFTGIHIVYNVFGKIDREKAQKAADLSIEKYCSVSKMLEKSAEITYKINVNPNET